MAGKLRPVRVGDVYQIDNHRFEVTAFDVVRYPRMPMAIGVQTTRGQSWEAQYAAEDLADLWTLISGGMGQAVEVE